MGVLAGFKGVQMAMNVGRRRWVTALAALLTFVGLIVALLAQIEVTHSAAGVTRTCGSAFDSVVDRSGWELWWARDLDEPDDSVRSALVRTDLCPTAVNRRTAMAAVFGSLALVLAILTRPLASSAERQSGTSPAAAARLVRLGNATSWVGGSLTVAGMLAIIALVADADSTMFLYTDRFVVGIVGLIVLMPTIALFVIGRVLTMVGTHLSRNEQEHQDV